MAAHLLLPKKVPFQLRKPYIPPRSRGTTAVTIAVSLRYDKGVLLCADRLMTHGSSADPSAFSHYEKKVFEIQAGKGRILAFVGAGEPQLMKQMFQRLVLEFNIKPASGGRPQYIDDYLTETLEDIFAKRPDSHLDMLLADSYADGRTILFRSEGSVANWFTDYFECLGIGETSLIRFMADNFVRPSMQRRNAIILGIYLVFLAKKYVPQYCGGQTDILDVSGGNCTEIGSELIQFIERTIETEQLHSQQVLDYFVPSKITL